MEIKNFPSALIYQTTTPQNKLSKRSFVPQDCKGDTVSFKKNIQKSQNTNISYENFKKAQKLAKNLSQNEFFSLERKSLKHLDGIQYGLKTFEKLSIEEIYFLLSEMDELTIPITRDCSGMCSACNVNGRPAEFDKPEQLRKIDFDDFKNLTQDLKTIAKRLNLNYFDHTVQKKIKNFSLTFPSNSLFYDSDGKDIWLKDSKDKIHEFPELNKSVYKATGLPGLFDTAGWARTNTKVQKRMEDLAKYYSDPKHEKEIDQINISINTYHGIVEKANQYLQKGDTENYERLLNIYAKNIANALYTFTPLVGKEFYGIMTKSVDNKESETFDNYKPIVLMDIIAKTFVHLKALYQNDLDNKNYKFVKNEDDMHELCYKQMQMINDIDTKLTPSAKNNIFSEIGKDKINYLKDSPNLTYKDILENLNGNILIDVNGQVYLSNDAELFKTDIQLNFKNKDKQTKALYPIPDKRVLHIKKEKLI